MYCSRVIFVKLSLIALVFVVGNEASSWHSRWYYQTRTTSLATFNAALIPLFSGQNGSDIKERTSLLIKQIEESDLDIVCLQEIFFADVQQEIYRALKFKYPYILSSVDLEADTSTDKACTATEIQLAIQCIVGQCPGLQGRELAFCTAISCGPVSNTFSMTCQECLVINSESLLNCGNEPASRYRRSFGLMLLSRKEMKNTATFPYLPQSNIRGYLSASVDGVGDLVCTHSTALLSVPAYVGPPIVFPFLFNSYEEQQFTEINTLFELIDTKDNPILMGDFNHGPASVGKVTWESPFNYGLMTARGFDSPYVIRDGRCTFCMSNLAVDFPANLLIDHIYVRTNAVTKRVISSRRIFDDVFTDNGVPLSDHYGVEVRLINIRSNCRAWEKKNFFCVPSLPFLQLPAPLPELVRFCEAVRD